MKFIKSLFCVLGFISMPWLLPAQVTVTHSDAESARLFVQHFYDWYVPLTKRDDNDPSFETAIRTKGVLFSKELLIPLEADAAAQKQVSDYAVGLDFDPFLDSQDPSDRYDVGDVSNKNDRYWVEVYGTRYGERSSKPNVVVELVRDGSRWKFANFHYPDRGEDLLQVLKALSADRSRNKK